MSEGVDVSRHQDPVNWGAAHGGGIEFAYVKLTEGVGYVDPEFDMHFDAARNAGLLAGAYHFGRPDTNAPEADAESFAEQLVKRGLAAAGFMPPCLDMETDARVNMINWSQRFFDRVRAITGYGLMLEYANSSWWINQLGGGHWLDGQTWAWVAHYGRAPGQPGWKGDRAVMHQYTSDGHIPGYGPRIDRDFCWVDLGMLTQGGAPASVPPRPDPAPDGWYTVQSGDTLSAIGAAVGIDWHLIASWNGLGNPDLIYPGQRLRLTAPEPAGGTGGTYTVKPGDTLSGIGSALGVDWHRIWEANRGLIGGNPDRILVGWVLAIPGAAPAPAPPPPAPVQRIYVVQPGDTLSEIAEKLGGLDWHQLARDNGITNPNLIHPGEEIRY